MPAAALAPVQFIENRIFLIRGQKVMLDEHLAALYKVETKRLNEAVQRNSKRFPKDFMFRLTTKEATNLRSQNATSSSAHGGRRNIPFAFTELGIAMLSSVLNSDRAIAANISIMRVFVQLRHTLANNDDLRRKIEELQAVQREQSNQLQSIFEALELFSTAPATVIDDPKPRIGFPTSQTSGTVIG